MRRENIVLNGIASYLVKMGYLTEQVIHSTLIESLKKKIPFIVYLGQCNYLSYLQLAEATANYFGLPLFDLNSYDLNVMPTTILSARHIHKYLVLPLFVSGTYLLLAVSDPTAFDVSEINFITGMVAIMLVVETDKLTKIIEQIYSHQFQLKNNELEESIALPTAETQSLNDLSEINYDSSPLVKYLNHILLEAIAQKASDIHFETYEKFYRIRYRIDGILYEVRREHIHLSRFLTARLKVMANLDITERRIPQDGRFQLSLPKNRIIYFRLNTCPALYGEKSVVRILESSHERLNVEGLGMDANQKELFLQALSHPQGLILVTGPTGSGKTITLYTALEMLNKEGVNICTVEDPIEMYLQGINQVQVNPKINLTFAATLRAFLRQDPDIIMVGEVRDRETAEVAMKASQTGHLVFTTLHTNSAVETLTRLASMGVAPFNIASSIKLIIAQRLVRRLCLQCKEVINISRATSGVLMTNTTGNEVIYTARGCRECNQGYKGRIGIYELLPISQKMSELIIAGKDSVQLAEQAGNENILNLAASAMQTIKAGHTSIEEVNRVINLKN
ncbi:MAG: Flp pilus assembly complex ATPase component TadA [Gammaproteobacteria bacterium]|nr:Flp pilus assembly complex ATPase component TadA [Gammaproteobacteria bacterium]